MTMKNLCLRIAVYIVVGYVISAGYILLAGSLNGIGFPLDDAWIHQTYARNFGLSGIWSYGLDSGAGGSTAPLWTALLAIGWLFRIDPIWWSWLLGGASLGLLASVADIAVGRYVGGSPVWMRMLAAGFLLFEYHLVWASASGMETLLYALLVCLVLFLVPSKIPDWGAGVIVGAIVWLRPDGITLAAPALLWLILLNRDLKSKVFTSLWFILGMFIFTVPYLLFNQIMAGSWWPSTFYAKQAEYAVLLNQPLWERIWQLMSTHWIGAGSLLVPGFLWMFISGYRQRNWPDLLAIAWWIGTVLLYALRLPVTYQHGRYMQPAMAVFFILGIIGWIHLLNAIPTLRWRRLATVFLWMTVYATVIGFAIIGATQYARDVAFINGEMVAPSRWIAENTYSGTLVAAHDIGALGFFGERRILDLAGLISPELIPVLRDEAGLASVIDDAGAEYLMTFPDWYEELEMCGTPVFTGDGAFSQSPQGAAMTVYRWNGNCLP